MYIYVCVRIHTYAHNKTISCCTTLGMKLANGAKYCQHISNTKMSPVSIPWFILTCALSTDWIKASHLLCLPNSICPFSPTYLTSQPLLDHVSSSLNCCCLHKYCNTCKDFGRFSLVLWKIVIRLQLEGKRLKVRGPRFPMSSMA